VPAAAGLVNDMPTASRVAATGSAPTMASRTRLAGVETVNIREETFQHL
jgi:hypothetical protein